MTDRKLAIAIATALTTGVVLVASPAYAADEDGKPRCAYNPQIGGACTDVTGNGWWSGSEAGAPTDQNGTTSYKDAEDIGCKGEAN